MPTGVAIKDLQDLETSIGVVDGGKGAMGVDRGTAAEEKEGGSSSVRDVRWKPEGGGWGEGEAKAQEQEEEIVEDKDQGLLISDDVAIRSTSDGNSSNGAGSITTNQRERLLGDVVATANSHIHNLVWNEKGELYAFGCGSGGRCGVAYFVVGANPAKPRKSRMKAYMR